jgi:thiamine-phosphate pyrophosphorylase
MARSQQAVSQRPAPRLYLVTPLIEDAAAFARVLSEAIAAVDVAAVLLRLAPAGERDLINRVKTLASVVQDKDIALLLDGAAEIAARAGADGAHMTGLDAFTAAVESLKPARIAGCGGLKSRDDAMTAGERGADYVMFGEPKPDGYRPPLEAILERVEWWADLFQIPCVAYAATPDEAATLVAADADFIAVGGSLWDEPRGAAAAIGEMAARLAAPERVP